MKCDIYFSSERPYFLWRPVCLRFEGKTVALTAELSCLGVNLKTIFRLAPGLLQVSLLLLYPLQGFAERTARACAHCASIACRSDVRRCCSPKQEDGNASRLIISTYNCGWFY